MNLSFRANQAHFINPQSTIRNPQSKILRLASPSGLSAELNANGSLRRFDHGPICLNLFPGNEVEGGPANIHVRRHRPTLETLGLLGPGSPAVFAHPADGEWTACGEWRDLVFRLRLVLAQSAPAWFWHLELENRGQESITCDLIHTQDLGLAHYRALRLNEYYVSQYVDHTPLTHARHGVAVASRQNQAMGGCYPWTVIGSLGRGVAYATDALQFHGLAVRAGDPPIGLTRGLPGARRQHEHSLACIQDELVVLVPGEVSRRGFFAWFEPHHPGATDATDLALIEAALTLPEALPAPWPQGAAEGCPAAVSLFRHAPLLETSELTAGLTISLFGNAPRHAEYQQGRLLSFFTGACNHVVMKAKELQVLRPHGHLLRSGSALTPDETALTSTCWMAGVFHSMVTQGHVSINRFLSTCHGYLGLFRSHGQRVFIETTRGWELLDTPSAFAMTPAGCRWIYQHQAGLLEVVAGTDADRHQLHLRVSVLAGSAARFLISHHIALDGDDGSAAIPLHHEPQGNGVFVRANPVSDVGRRFPNGGFRLTAGAGTILESIGGDELLFGDGLSRHQPFLCFITAPALTIRLLIEGCLLDDALTENAAADASGRDLASNRVLRLIAPAASPLAPAALRLGEILPWFIHNALVHFLAPRGLEQFSGGGWGTRDVCQGPLELLMALGRLAPARDMLVTLFRNQNPDGDWPQWFMFFERERSIRPGDSHGDIVYWPVLALARYLSITGDASLLDLPVPFFHPEGQDAAESVSLRDHLQRALDLIARRVIAGNNKLAAYGHGDWNDALQPARPDMREHLCSSWTVTLAYQTFTALAEAFRSLGEPAPAAKFEHQAGQILDAFQRLLIVDEVVAGLMYFHASSAPDVLLHPRDTTTGLSYSLLPMIHAIINDMFSPAQASAHLDIIRQHLLGPDGAHLFDRPLAYRGGLQNYFQRAETASYFGREIGLMYTHAHLRYGEALARFGAADEFFHALCQANPIAMREWLPTAARRQANCYYSSSDPAFADRYDAFDHYPEVNSGSVQLDGGWRIYSSGAGISVRLIIQCFLGLRQEAAALIVDPVIPAALDGLCATLELAGRKLDVIYQIPGGGRGHGPLSLELNSRPLPFTRDANPYRPGAARVALADFTRLLNQPLNRLVIRLE